VSEDLGCLLKIPETACVVEVNSLYRYRIAQERQGLRPGLSSVSPAATEREDSDFCGLRPSPLAGSRRSQRDKAVDAGKMPQRRLIHRNFGLSTATRP
jgi:hypothetical protein